MTSLLYCAGTATVPFTFLWGRTVIFPNV